MIFPVFSSSHSAMIFCSAGRDSSSHSLCLKSPSRKFLRKRGKSRQNHKWQISFVRGSRSHVWHTNTETGMEKGSDFGDRREDFLFLNLDCMKKWKWDGSKFFFLHSRNHLQFVEWSQLPPPEWDLLTHIRDWPSFRVLVFDLTFSEGLAFWSFVVNQFYFI